MSQDQDLTDVIILPKHSSNVFFKEKCYIELSTTIQSLSLPSISSTVGYLMSP